MFVAPSPKKATATRGSCAQLERERCADGCRQAASDDGVRAHVAARRRRRGASSRRSRASSPRPCRTAPPSPRSAAFRSRARARARGASRRSRRRLSSARQTPTATASWPMQACRKPASSPARKRSSTFSSKRRISSISARNSTSCSRGSVARCHAPPPLLQPLDQVDEAAAVAPLVVVPAEDLRRASRWPWSAGCRRRTSTASGRCRWRRAARRRSSRIPASGPRVGGRPEGGVHLIAVDRSRDSTTRSTIEPTGTGALIASAPIFPSSSGSTVPSARVAPVVVGIRLIAAARARRRSLCGASRTRLRRRVGVHGRHEAALDPERVMEHLRQRRDAVRRAGGVRDDSVALWVVGVVVDAENERHVGVVGHGRDHDSPCAGVEVRLRLVALLEASGRLDDHVDTELAPGKIRRVGNRERPQPALADGDRVPVGCNLLGERGRGASRTRAGAPSSSRSPRSLRATTS